MPRQTPRRGMAPDPEFDDLVMLVRPRKSRIFYLRKLFDYPLKLDLATLRNLGVVRTREGGLQLCGQRPAAHPSRENARGFSHQPLRPAFVPNIFQKLHRKSVGRALRPNQRRMGRAAHQGPVAAQSPGPSFQETLQRPVQRRSAKRTRRPRSSRSSSIPKLGPGQLWEEVASRVCDGGGEILTGWTVSRHSHLGRPRHGCHRAQRRRRTALFPGAICVLHHAREGTGAGLSMRRLPLKCPR